MMMRRRSSGHKRRPSESEKGRGKKRSRNPRNPNRHLQGQFSQQRTSSLAHPLPLPRATNPSALPTSHQCPTGSFPFGVFVAKNPDTIRGTAQLRLQASEVEDTYDLCADNVSDALCDSDCFPENHVHAEFDEDRGSCIVRGRLRQNMQFWKDIGTSRWVLDIIGRGYYLPLVADPKKKLFKNHASVAQQAEFVESAILKLLVAGSVLETDQEHIHICSPLGVVPKKNNKFRLILDLRYLNQHLASFKFKFEDLRVASQLLDLGDWFFTFDLFNGYHHIDIGVEHRKYLGFSELEGKDRFFTFASLPFGLSTAPYVFTKVMKPLVSYWRGNAKKLLMYMDDGIGAAASETAASQLATEVKNDLDRSGLMVNAEKSDFQPRQCGEFLGYTLNLRIGQFQVPKHKTDGLQSLLLDALTVSKFITARSLAKITGVIISMGLALGPVARLFTRSLYRAQNSVPSLCCKVSISEEAFRELIFWRDNFRELDGQPMWQSSPRTDVISYSDASSTGWGGYVVQLGNAVARGHWQEEDAGRSSTFRELKAIRLVLASFAHRLKFKECKHRTDNQNTCSIMCIGSNNQDLQQEAVRIFAICRIHGIRLHPEWVPRHLNKKADYWSRVIDTDDWMLNPAHFRELDMLWGPHTIDRFASFNSKQLPRFCARWQCPGCETVDSFTVGWDDENNWIVPPIYCISRIIRHMSFGREAGTLVVPLWTSAPWWPLLAVNNQQFKSFVVGVSEIPRHEATFLPGSAESDLFGHGVPSSRVLALRIDFTYSKCW